MVQQVADFFGDEAVVEDPFSYRDRLTLPKFGNCGACCSPPRPPF